MSWIKRGTETTIKDVFLRNIGASSLETINDWFRKSYADQYRIDGMQQAVEMALSFKDRPVTIVGDYDADGVTATSIMRIILRYARFSDVRFRIPKRFSEGYGINNAIIDEIASYGGLIITVDNGIAQSEAIARAKGKGLTVIVTDHHLPAVDEEGTPTLPPADLIIDPNAVAGSADFNGYCGAGLAFRFAQEMLKVIGKNNAILASLQSLAAVGTIADVMALREENYVIVRNGLSHMTDSYCNPGLQALISALGLRYHVDAHDVGFKIAPCINAASRMYDDGAMYPVILFSDYVTWDLQVQHAEFLVKVNEERKAAKAEGLAKAHQIIDDECLYGDTPLVLQVPDVREGIIGIIAGSLAEEFKVPAFVFTNTEDGLLKGSARSYGNYDVKSELDKIRSLFTAYGGHTGAAGMTLKPENFDEMKSSLIENLDAEGTYEAEEITDIPYDLEISAAEVPAALKELNKYAPFGEGNPNIVFKVTGFSTVPRYGAYKKLLGADGSTVKLWSASSTAIGFGLADRLKNADSPKLMDLVGTLSDSYFTSKDPTHQIEFVDFTLHELETKVTPLAAKLAAMSMAH